MLTLENTQIESNQPQEYYFGGTSIFAKLQKFIRTSPKVIALVALVFMVTGVAAAATLVKNNQDTRQQASGTDCPGNWCEGTASNRGSCPGSWYHYSASYCGGGAVLCCSQTPKPSQGGGGGGGEGGVENACTNSDGSCKGEYTKSHSCGGCLANKCVPRAWVGQKTCTQMADMPSSECGCNTSSGSLPATCTYNSNPAQNQKGQCGQGCHTYEQKVCQPGGTWGACSNSTACGYQGNGCGGECSLDTHCQSGMICFKQSGQSVGKCLGASCSASSGGSGGVCSDAGEWAFDSEEKCRNQGGYDYCSKHPVLPCWKGSAENDVGTCSGTNVCVRSSTADCTQKGGELVTASCTVDTSVSPPKERFCCNLNPGTKCSNGKNINEAICLSDGRLKVCTNPGRLDENQYTVRFCDDTRKICKDGSCQFPEAQPPTLSCGDNGSGGICIPRGDCNYLSTYAGSVIAGSCLNPSTVCCKPASDYGCNYGQKSPGGSQACKGWIVIHSGVDACVSKTFAQEERVLTTIYPDEDKCKKKIDPLVFGCKYFQTAPASGCSAWVLSADQQSCSEVRTLYGETVRVYPYTKDQCENLRAGVGCGLHGRAPSPNGCKGSVFYADTKTCAEKTYIPGVVVNDVLITKNACEELVKNAKLLTLGEQLPQGGACAGSNATCLPGYDALYVLKSVCPSEVYCAPVDQRMPDLCRASDSTCTDNGACPSGWKRFQDKLCTGSGFRCCRIPTSIAENEIVSTLPASCSNETSRCASTGLCQVGFTTYTDWRCPTQTRCCLSSVSFVPPRCASDGVCGVCVPRETSATACGRDFIPVDDLTCATGVRCYHSPTQPNVLASCEDTPVTRCTFSPAGSTAILGTCNTGLIPTYDPTCGPINLRCCPPKQ